MLVQPDLNRSGQVFFVERSNSKNVMEYIYSRYQYVIRLKHSMSSMLLELLTDRDLLRKTVRDPAEWREPL